MYMKQKRLIILVLSFMVLCFCSCQKREIRIDGKESFFIPVSKLKMIKFIFTAMF